MYSSRHLFCCVAGGHGLAQIRPTRVLNQSTSSSIMLLAHLCRSGSHGGLRGLRANSYVQFAKGGLEVLRELSKALELSRPDGFLALVFYFQNLQGSRNDLLLGVPGID